VVGYCLGRGLYSVNHYTWPLIDILAQLDYSKGTSKDCRRPEKGSRSCRGDSTGVFPVRTSFGERSFFYRSKPDK
jgi:hypothetical protein